MKERSEQLLVAEIFGACYKRAYTVSELCNKIYKNGLAKNQIRIYQILEILMKNGMIKPVFKHRELKYIRDESPEEME